jgi:hypothetical protein
LIWINRLRSAPPKTVTAGRDQEAVLLDFILLAGGVGFLVLTVLYAYACERM